ncbi:hypothetical protein V8G54_023439 [Vigna mungo]|uniref:Yippee domain-containing protein n=1 Tax=Vigna mungo TaxID=3915 RepID=A0AAQ3N3L7_VIGMU
MGRIFTVELEGRSYGCKSCKTHLALADDLISRFAILMGVLFLFNSVIQCELHDWSARGKDDAFWTAYCGRYLLLLLWSNCWLEIFAIFYQESAHERSQKYKEGKFVLERGRIVDEIDFTAEFHIESCVSMSDAEDA